eukprot:PITA_08873
MIGVAVPKYVYNTISKYTTICSIISLGASQGWKLHQMDIKTAFLHGSNKEEVYMEQPEGFEIYDRKYHVCRLKKALYGLKQAPRAWYERIDSYLMKLGLTRSEVDPNLYFKIVDDKPLILVLYVDDLFIIGVDPLIQKCKRELASEFEMKDLGLMHYFLGLEVWQKPREIFVSQGKNVVKRSKRFGMVDCKPVTTSMELDFKKLSGSAAGPILRNATEYCQLVEALMLLVNSRPDICFAVNTLSQNMVEPHHTHWIGAKNLLRYLRGTIIYWLRYTAGDVRLLGYTDVDWAGSVVDFWLRKLFSELFGFTLDITVILCDNQSGIHLSKNPVFHDHSKHIDIRMIRSLMDRMIRSLVDMMIRSLVGQDDSLSCGQDDLLSCGQDDSISCGTG